MVERKLLPGPDREAREDGGRLQGGEEVMGRGEGAAGAPVAPGADGGPCMV